MTKYNLEDFKRWLEENPTKKENLLGVEDFLTLMEKHKENFVKNPCRVIMDVHYSQEFIQKHFQNESLKHSPSVSSKLRRSIISTNNHSGSYANYCYAIREWKFKVDLTNLETKLNLVHTKLQQWTELLLLILTPK